MKSILLLMVIGLGVACGDTIPDWLTATGRHYKDVDVVEIKPDGISIRHQDGVAKIPFDELTPAQRATYHLTQEGRADYEKRKSEEARHAAAVAEAARQNLSESPATPPTGDKPPADHATAVPASVHYVTVEEIKRAWAAALTLPRTLDKNYRSLMRSRDSALRAITSGSRDREAEKKAAQYNKDLALKAGDNARAAVEEQTLARISQEEAEIARHQQEEEHQRQILAANQANSQPQPPAVVYDDPPYYPSAPCPPVCPPSRPPVIYTPPSPEPQTPVPAPPPTPPTPPADGGGRVRIPY